MHNKLSYVAALMCAVVSFSATARTIYVDKSVAVSGDGTSWATAFKTIQEGCDAASSSEVDTVLVAPGEYGDDQGYANVTASATGGQKSQNCRVWINKKLILKSRDGKEVTHIVGHRGDGNGGNDANGNEPVMCVLIKKAPADDTAIGAVVEGFTIRDGEMSATMGDAGPGGIGNPFFTNYDEAHSNYFYVAYCTISNCCARRAAGMRAGTAIGTLFAENTTWDASTIGQASMNNYAYNCIFTRHPRTAIVYGYALVNCTICNNGCSSDNDRPSFGTYYYNSASFDNGKCGDTTNGGALYSSLFDGGPINTTTKKPTQVDVQYISKSASNDTTSEHAKLCMAACAGDFRPVSGGYLYGYDGHYGRIEYTNLDFIPPEYKQRDFYGKKLANNAVIPIGAILPAATSNVKPLRIGSADVSINGSRVLVAGQFVHSETVHDQIEIAPASDEGKDSFGIKINDSDIHQHPRRDGTYLYTFRTKDAEGDTFNTLEHFLADCTYFVDRDSGDDDKNDGLSAESAFQSLQHAVDVTSAQTGVFVIKVTEGTYDNQCGTGTSMWGNTTDARARVLINRSATSVNRLLLWATGDRERTVIEGSLDNSLGASYNGVGPNALRCVVVMGSSNTYVGISGFTLRNGRPTGTSKDDDCRAGMGGAIVSYRVKTVAQDCAFTGNVAHSGSVASTIVFNRCRFYGNDTMALGTVSKSTKCTLQGGVASSCIFEDNLDAEMISPGITASRFYNCTVFMTNANTSAYVYQNSVAITNSIIWSAGTYVAPSASKGGGLGGNIFWGTSSVTATSGYQIANPKFFAPEEGDYRINYNSPALSGGTEFTDDMAAYIVGDYYGNPIRFAEDGKVVIGAVHSFGKERPYPGLTIVIR